ncbi:MAG: vitamin K epoxide reductase family protein, partial [Planctomycetes bacterium]|nr:vitamin K epoxide reductase family protein [Planctomycetota bacterium]
GSGVLIITAVVSSLYTPNQWRQHCGLIFIAASCICIAALIPGLWPCELACSAGASYAQIFGISFHLIAVIVYFSCAVCALSSLPSHYVLLLSAACGASSVYYLILSANLNMLCPLCMCVHSFVLAACCLQFQRNEHCWRRCSIAIISGLLLFTAYYFRSPLIEISQPNETSSTNVQNDTFTTALNQRRILQSAQAPAQYTLHCFLRISCQHCSEALPIIIADSKTLNDDFSCAIVFHFLVNEFSQADIDQAHLALASCLDNQQQLALLALIGHNAEDTDSAAILNDLSLPVKSYQKVIKNNTKVFNKILSESLALLNTCDVAMITPVFLLQHTTNQKHLGLWNGHQGWPAVMFQLPQIISDIKQSGKAINTTPNNGHQH